MAKQFRNTIFIVENNRMMAKLAEKLLSSMYDCKLFETPEKAIWQLRKGVIPAVILTSTVFPEMSGEEFIKVAKKLAPATSTILITSRTETKDLIQLLNFSNTDFYLNKPYNNLKLLQYCRVGAELFTFRCKEDEEPEEIVEVVDNKEKIKTLLENYKKFEVENNNVKSQLIKSISNLIMEAERFYYRPHTKEVLSICRRLANILGLDEKSETRMSYIALLHNHYLIDSPDKFRTIDPRFEEDDDAEVFNAHFKKSAANLATIDIISDYAKMTSLIYENIDGTGQPNGLNGINIPKEVQIVSIVNLYHNLMYRIDKDDMEELKLEGEIVLNKKDILERYRNATTVMYKNIKWFDHDLFYKFQELIKKQDTEDLKFYNRDIKMFYKKEDYAMPEFNDKLMEAYLKRQLLATYRNIEKTDAEGNQYFLVEKKTKISRLKIGDELRRDIENVDGALIYKAGTIIDEMNLGKLEKQLRGENVSDLAYIIEDQEA